MNLDKASSITTLEPLAPPDWSMDVRHEGRQITAEVKRSSVLMCRVSIVRPDDDDYDEAAARAALADKARRWIHDYLVRSSGR